MTRLKRVEEIEHIAEMFSIAVENALFHLASEKNDVIREELIRVSPLGIGAKTRRHNLT